MLSPQYSTYAAMSKSYNELMYFKLYRSHENPIADSLFGRKGSLNQPTSASPDKASYFTPETNLTSAANFCTYPERNLLDCIVRVKLPLGKAFCT